MSTSCITFDGSAGGESKATPAFCTASAADAVVTTVVSVVVVDVGGLGVLGNGDLSKLFKEVGELGGKGASSDRRWGLGLARDMDSRRSTAGLEVGGGMLMLALSAGIAVVSVWGFRRKSGALLAANKECVESVRSTDRVGLELPADEVVNTGANSTPSD